MQTKRADSPQDRGQSTSANTDFCTPQRFEREAKVLASLNHPNIASIYGLEQAEFGAGHLEVASLVLRRGQFSQP